MTPVERRLRERVERAAMRWHRKAVRFGSDDLAVREAVWFLGRKCAALSAHLRKRK